jgi:ABC-type transporter Mla MlaB component
MGTTTQFLLDGSSVLGEAAVAESEAAAVIEEAAIMYANGQAAVVEQMLHSAIEEDLLGNEIEEAWLMLFDLYQIRGKQQEFEQLSLAYASRFETSPPAWSGPARQDLPQAENGASPAVPFAGRLDAASKKNIDRIAKLAETRRALRLDFMRVTEVDATGCDMLLTLLQRLQKAGNELMLAGAPELAEKIRAVIEVGRRDETDHCWLLLLEILRLLDREKEFEETSIDYCVTFEVSPPAFVSPQGKVTAVAPEQHVPASPSPENFMMPRVVEGRIDHLILSIASYSDEHNPAVLDCSRLERVDFNAAGRLLTGLAPFCGVGRTLEFHHVNHLVAALFHTIGLKDIARIVPRKG